MTNTTLQNETLNTLTTACTSFTSWFEFSEAMTTGYTPTLRTFPGRSKANVAQNAKVEELIRRLTALGYAVWTGN